MMSAFFHGLGVAALFAVAASVPLESKAFAAPEEVKVGQALPRFEKLKPGVRRYLRHREMNGVVRSIDIWTREVRFEEREGKPLLRIVQQWTGPASAPHTLRLDSWFERGTFRPITHERFYERAEEKRNEGFRFLADKIGPLETTPGNVHKKFEMASPEATFNFETDMEFLQTLALAPGYEASIRFYHPGGPAPAAYIFKVAGAERLAGPGGEPIDCWLVTTDYNVPSAKPARFWVSKKDQIVLKVEQVSADGSKTVKTLLY
jgi:hypothetical protein